jgi:sugar phosphate isomerase/epimerase
MVPARISAAIFCLLPVLALAQPAADIPRPRINHDAIARLGVRLGVQAYTFRALSTFETIEVLQAMGIKYIELYPGQRFSREDPDLTTDVTLSDENIGRLLRKLEQGGVTAVSFGVTPLTANEADNRRRFEFARKMRLEAIVSEPTLNKATWDSVEKLAEEYRIRVAVHNHPRPNTYWGPQIVKDALAGRSPLLGCCADVGHWARSGLVPVEGLKTVDGRLIELHLKDVDTNTTRATDVPWGSGVVDARGIMAQVQRQVRARRALEPRPAALPGNPLFAIEYESSTGRTLLENVAKCAEAFSRLAEELAQAP